MSHLSRIGNKISVSIQPDEDGYIGRECPVQDCNGYFKITLGTGLKGITTCYCAYCGYKAEQREFGTKEQIEFATSVAFKEITDAALKDLKALEISHPPRGSFGIGVSLKVSGHPAPIRYYREKKLETEVICDHCALRYAIYGVFAFCPDCGIHNSLQILEKNLELAEKEVQLAASIEEELGIHLVADALENEVSTFDGFGREICRINASKATNPLKADDIHFQNLPGARKRVQDAFGFDIAAGVSVNEWEVACRSFQKRHLLAHKMGVVDEAYMKATNDSDAVIGRKIQIQSGDVTALADILKRLGAYLASKF